MTPSTGIPIVELASLDPSDLVAMRRHEVVEHAVQVRHGALAEVEDHFVVPDWDDTKRAEICARVGECIGTGGAAWGATVRGTFVALAAVDARPVGNDPEVVALDLLHVSAPFRGRGLARILTERAAAFAQSLSAHTLYVSATNTAHTVAFYRRFGAVVADPPDPAWFAREPLDVHLRLPLPTLRSGRPMGGARGVQRGTGGPDQSRG